MTSVCAAVLLSVAASLAPSSEITEQSAPKSDLSRVSEDVKKSRDIWKQPNGDLVIGEEYEVNGESVNAAGEKEARVFRIRFEKTDSGVNLMVNGTACSLQAIIGRIPVWRKEISVESGQIIVRGAGLKGINPGKSVWNPESLAAACRDLSEGNRHAFTIQGERIGSDDMEGILTPQKVLPSEAHAVVTSQK